MSEGGHDDDSMYWAQLLSDLGTGLPPITNNDNNSYPSDDPYYNPYQHQEQFENHDNSLDSYLLLDLHREESDGREGEQEGERSQWIEGREVERKRDNERDGSDYLHYLTGESSTVNQREEVPVLDREGDRVISPVTEVIPTTSINSDTTSLSVSQPFPNAFPPPPIPLTSSATISGTTTAVGLVDEMLGMQRFSRLRKYAPPKKASMDIWASDTELTGSTLAAAAGGERGSVEELFVFQSLHNVPARVTESGDVLPVSVIEDRQRERESAEEKEREVFRVDLPSATTDGSESNTSVNVMSTHVTGKSVFIV